MVGTKKESQNGTKFNRKKITFAPESGVGNYLELVKPGRGGEIEVVVVWHERILRTKTCSLQKDYTLGYDKSCDIVLPRAVGIPARDTFLLKKSQPCLVLSEFLKPEWFDEQGELCLLYTSPSPRDATLSRMPSSA